MIKILLLLCLIAGVEPGANVPPIAEHEIQLRGDMVQELGTTRASEVDAIADALAPPEDDSHKWHFTLITTSNCAPCERLKRDILQAKELKAWIDVDNPKESRVHYQSRRADDPTQADWLRNVKARLDAGGFPAIVIQPPSNSEYGPPSRVVAIVHGYDGKPDALVKTLAGKVKTYVAALYRKGEIKHIGDNSERGGGNSPSAIAAKPPFLVPDNPPDQFQPVGPFDWPPQQPLTATELAELAPGAPPDWILDQLKLKATATTAKAAWEKYLADNPTEPEIDLNPSLGQPFPWEGATVLIVACLIGLALYRLQTPHLTQSKAESTPAPAKRTAKKPQTKNGSTTPRGRTR